jgi:adenosine deaminase
MTSEIRKLNLKYIKNDDSNEEPITLNFNITISGNSDDQLFFSTRLLEIIEELTKEDYITKSEYNLKQTEIKLSLKNSNKHSFRQHNKTIRNGNFNGSHS